MTSLADLLPSEIAAQIDPVWRKNEAAYWVVRECLLERHRDKWIGYADGAIVASGSSPVAVFHAAEASAISPFVTCVGREDEPTMMRRTTFPYDSTYSGEPLPVLVVEFRTVSGSPGMSFDKMIADTGADATALPWVDCRTLNLDPTKGRPSRMGSVAGGYAGTLLFHIWVWIDGQEYAGRQQADFVGHERILGRDVLNRLDVLFRGPAGEVVINP